MSDDDAKQAATTSRRAVMVTLGAAGTMAALTKYASAGTSTAAPDPDGSAAPSATPSGPESGSPAPSSPPSSGTPQPTASGTVLGPVTDIPVGGGTIYPAQKVVVTQPVANEFHGFSAVCTHQGCLCEQVANATINCPCHGSRFAIADGSVKGGPAKSPLPKVNVTVVDGQVILG
jgi:Rieske Fe-S protein